jgi:RecA-family ATPase
MLERDDRHNSAETRFFRWLCKYLAGQEWRLIIADPLSRFAGPDAEVDNAEGTRFVQTIESMSALTGATTLVSHHTNKTSRGRGSVVTGASGRGSTSLFDGFRWQASLAVQEQAIADEADERGRVGEVVTLACTKSNYSRKFEPVTLRRSEEGPLIALEAAELTLLRSARARTPERRATEAEARRSAADAKKKTDAEKRHGDKHAQRQRENDELDRAVVRVLARAWPAGLNATDLRTDVQAEAECGGVRADVAIARLKIYIDALGRRPKVSTLKVSALPGELLVLAKAENPKIES